MLRAITTPAVMSSERRGQFKISPLRRYDRNGWKQSVRERCLEQVRARRRLLIAKARAASACQGDVHEELRSMIRESVASVRHQHHLAPAEAADDVAWPMDSDDLGTAGGVMAAVDEELHYDEFVDLMQQMEELLQQEVDAEGEKAHARGARSTRASCAPCARAPAERMMTEYERAEHADAEAVSELAKEVEDGACDAGARSRLHGLYRRLLTLHGASAAGQRGALPGLPAMLPGGAQGCSVLRVWAAHRYQGALVRLMSSALYLTCAARAASTTASRCNTSSSSLPSASSAIGAAPVSHSPLSIAACRSPCIRRSAHLPLPLASAVCAQPPQFQRMERFGIQSLVMQCGACGSFECVV